MSHPRGRAQLIALALATSALLSACRGAHRDDEDLLRLTRIGRAHVEDRESEPAVAALTSALARAPRSPTALRNLARAELLAQRPVDALALLSRIGGSEGASAATRYLMGIAMLRAGRHADAVPLLEEAARLDGRQAAIRYQLGVALQGAGRLDEAEVRFREAFDLDARHVSAAFRVARMAHRRGDAVEAARWDREFLRLRAILGDHGRSDEELEGCIYTEIEVPEASQPPSPPIAVVLRDDTSLVLDGAAPLAACAAPLRVEDDGSVSVVVAAKDGAMSLLRWNASRHAMDVTSILGSDAALGEARALVVGDCGEGAPPAESSKPARGGSDLLVVGTRGARLLIAQPSGGYADVTAASGLVSAAGERAAWADVDHDGDLDVLIAGRDGLRAWNDNGDGSFAPMDAASALRADGPVLDVAVADLDADVAVDVLVARTPDATGWLRGRHLGSFEQAADAWEPASRVIADYLDSDAALDVLLLREGALEAQLRGGGRREVVDLPALRAAAMTTVDYDNDGHLDVIVAGRATGASLRGFRNDGSGRFEDVSRDLRLDAVALPSPRDLIAIDMDGDGDSDLLVIGDDGTLRFLRNDGGNARRQVKLRLAGTKSNADGLGASVELATGAFLTRRRVTSPVVEIGVASHDALDVVRAVWTTGVVDNVVDAKPGRAPIVVEEKLVAAGSCPFLYAWDGARFRFVTDLLGGAPLGLPLARGVMLEPHPEEVVVIGDATTLGEDGGRLVLEITGEFRETIYLDRVELLCVDHPREVEACSTSSLGFPPFEPPRLVGVSAPVAPIAATGSDGIDRTREVAALDGAFSEPGRLRPSPFRGVVEPLALALDFGPLDRHRARTLVLTGWLQYGDSSTNIALSQLRTPILGWPRLLAESADGSRIELPAQIGLPAGKTKTVLVDMPDLPADTRRVILESAFELRWDRIALADRPQDLSPVVLSLLEADLRFRGFSEIASRAPGHPTTPDPERVSPLPPWRTVPEGWCTRYGDVRELIATRDGKLVVLDSGDALRLSFDATTLPLLAAGASRTFALRTIGWVRDGDHNTEGGTRVEPLPPAGGAVEDADWQLRYQTRFVARDAFAP